MNDKHGLHSALKVWKHNEITGNHSVAQEPLAMEGVAGSQPHRKRPGLGFQTKHRVIFILEAVNLLAFCLQSIPRVEVGGLFDWTFSCARH